MLARASRIVLSTSVAVAVAVLHVLHDFMSFLFRLLNPSASQMPTARAATRRVNRIVPLALLTAAVASACQFDTITVPDGRERPVVHAVLNPWATEQIIL